MLLLVTVLTSWGVVAAASACPAVDEAYGSVASLLRPGHHFLGEEWLDALFNTLENRVQCGEVSCEKCNLSNAVRQIIHESQEGRKNNTVDASQFATLAAGCVLYLSSPSSACIAARRGSWALEIERFLHEISSKEHQNVEKELCTGPGHQHMDLHGLESVLGGFLRHYEPSDNESCVSASIIMMEVGASSPEPTQAVGAVLGRVLYHALRGGCFVSHSLPEERFFLDYIMNRLGSENFTITDLEAVMRSLDVGGAMRKKSSHQHSNTTWDQCCFSAHDLVLIHGLGGGDPTLDRSDLARLSPALVQQILSGACHATQPPKQEQLSITERYLYATLANIVITLTSMFGIVLLLCSSFTSLFQLCIQFCISLAVGSLTGDALLHLLPMFLGLHVHSGDTGSVAHPHPHQRHGHDDGNSEVPDYVCKMLVLMGGIYYFYLMEAVFSLFTYRHRHHGDASEPHHCDHGRVLEMYQQDKKQKYISHSTSTADLVKEEEEHDSSVVKDRTREQRLLPYMITFGDAIHNFADGLAMGAAFSLSWKSGLATSLAVLCHELPHELGDFAILLHSGMSVRRALLLNVGSAASSFVGLYIALTVATDLATKQWIAAITAGLFLYVGLADMLPTMVHINSRRPWLMFALQNVGILSGWAILLVLSLYEERISF
ncbi:zinc transporter ZIP4 isoform X2 [Dunckerocampus dactyliophorus]|uniref:zinc transporter ZIP4 isoform X2 n=1 Tax=Dunckerocampus dactyliophorus TaxID=161453 RepID=UPI0024059839|nr:zinc transporter ZIP4 isoform X2 [Dunckerocampus dactyliophorus]